MGVSDWIEVTQDPIIRFAEATCDEQWIHVDQERAKAEMLGGPIAHGFVVEPDTDVHAFGDGLKVVEETARTVSATSRGCRPDQGGAATQRPRTCRPTDYGEFPSRILAVPTGQSFRGY